MAAPPMRKGDVANAVPPSRGGDPLSRTAKNFLAVLVGLLFLLLLETGLALVGVVPLAREDPFVGFEGSLPLFLPASEKPGVYSLNPAKERHFDRQEFQVPKPEGRFRIIAFGGSTTYGRPYLNDTAFPAWMSRLLRRYDPSRSYESINAGGISYASYRVRRLVEEMAAYSPDLYVIYSGHNEFLESRTFEKIITEPPVLRRLKGVLHRSRLYSGMARLAHRAKGKKGAKKTILRAEVKARLEDVGGPELYHRDEEFRQGVIRQYRHNIEAMVRFCKVREIPLILCTVTSNLSGVSPFKSEHGAGLSPDDRRAWRKAFSAAEEAFRAQRLEEALSLLAKAEARDGRHAALHFRKGETLLALGRRRQALDAFVRAKEEDIIPLRALEVFNDIIRDVARRERVPLADIETGFRDGSPGGITGPGLFLDHVHPTLEGQQFMAWTILEKAAEEKMVPLTEGALARNGQDARTFLAGEIAKVTPRYRAMGVWGVGRLFHWAGMYREAYESLSAAWETIKDVEEIPRLLGALELWRRQPSEARAYFQESLRIEPGNEKAILGLAKAHVDMLDGRAALDALEGLQPDSREGPRYLGVRGEALMLTGDLETALGDLRTAVRLAPEVQAYVYALAQARLLAGSEREARAGFGRFLRMGGEEWSDEAYEKFTRFTYSLPGGGPGDR